MSIKSKITALAIIMYLALICVGFASWTLSVDTKDAVLSDNVITSETIINTNEEITIESVTNFKYFNNGFINENDIENSKDNTLTYSANITVELKVNKEKCAEVTAELKINELISDLSFDSITCIIEGSTDTTVYGSKVTIDTSKMSTDTIKLVFTLNANKSTFISKVYTPLYNNMDKNIFSIELNVTKENITE